MPLTIIGKSETLKLSCLFYLGMVLVCLDIVNIDLGGFKLKIAYVAFVGYLTVFAFWFGLSLNRWNLAIAIVLVTSFFPSVLFTTSALTSMAFYAGTIMCVVIMLTFAKMAFLIGPVVENLLVNFYRFSIIVTLVLVITGLQTRGHFLFYEASYYAIALIPYLCIVFFRLFRNGLRRSLADLLLIGIAIVITASVSLVIWAALSFVVIYAKSGRARAFHLLIGLAVASLLVYIAVGANTRAQLIAEKISGLSLDVSGYLDLLIFVGGNRLQRVLVAYQAFREYPIVGVGLGALKSYASANFEANQFEVGGSSAMDFVAQMNATNIYLELAAEGGLVALMGFAAVLFYVVRRAKNSQAAIPLLIAFYVTMASLLAESSYLRTYVWALYGILIGLGAYAARSRAFQSGSSV